MIRERLGNVICMVLVLSANDIPGEGTLLFLAGEIPRANRNWGPDFSRIGAAAPRLAQAEDAFLE